MEVNLKEIRRKSFENIKMNFGNIAVMLGILFFINIIFSAISEIAILSIFSVVAFIFIGIVVSIFGLKIFRNDSPSYMVFLEVFANGKFFEYLKVTIGRLIFEIVLSIPIFVIFMIFSAVFFGNVAQIILGGSNIAEILTDIFLNFLSIAGVFLVIFIVLSIIFYIIKMSFECLYYITYDAKDNIRISSIFSLSNKLMKGNRFKYFLLDLRFIIMFIFISIIYFLSLYLGVMYFLDNGGIFLYFGIYSLFAKIIFMTFMTFVSVYRKVCFAGFYEQLTLSLNASYFK